jgi:RimJ/RimL family protein N-acetyltransferase
MSREFAEDALDRGDRCFSLFDGARMVSFGWYARQPTLISSGLLLHFDPAWVYMYRGYTLPAYRGQRLHGTGMALALREHARRGARGLITYVRSTNFASLRSVERMGYRGFGELYLARVLGRVETWTSPGCAEHGFHLENVATSGPLAAPFPVAAHS